MPSFRTGVVTEILDERSGLQKVRIAISPAENGDQAGSDNDEDGPERAYVLTAQVGPVEVGDEVVINTTAVDLGLGTGGWHFVHWNLSRRSWFEPGSGHIMKLRYSSLQLDTGAAEELEGVDPLSPRADLADLDKTLGGRPVVACTLHSQVPIIAAAYRAERSADRITYVMTDGAALPIALSDLMVTARDAGLIDATITAGHAFGGDLEAVSMPSALALAARDGADCVIVGMGPGVVGTSSPLGTTAVEAAWVLDTVAALGGRPILCVRASGADPRPRHQGASHHIDTVLALTRTAVQVPTVPGAEVEAPRHYVVYPEATRDVVAELAARGLRVTSMGRGPEDDPLFYHVAGAAGTWAATGAQIPED